jgi:hypothetical protein
VLNVTVTNTESDDAARTGGYCAIWGSADPNSWPGTSSVNWIGPGQTVANTVVTPVGYLGRQGGFIACLVAINRADVVIDAIGGFI